MALDGCRTPGKGGRGRYSRCLAVRGAVSSIRLFRTPSPAAVRVRSQNFETASETGCPSVCRRPSAANNNAAIATLGISAPNCLRHLCGQCRAAVLVRNLCRQSGGPKSFHVDAGQEGEPHEASIEASWVSHLSPPFP